MEKPHEWAAQFPCCAVIQTWLFKGSVQTVRERRFEQFPELHVCKGQLVSFDVWQHYESVEVIALDVNTKNIIHIHFTRQVRQVSTHVN